MQFHHPTFNAISSASGICVVFGITCTYVPLLVRVQSRFVCSQSPTSLAFCVLLPGLSYTTFEYSSLSVGTADAKPSATLKAVGASASDVLWTATVKVKNTGTVAGTEIVQVRIDQATVSRWIEMKDENAMLWRPKLRCRWRTPILAFCHFGALSCHVLGGVICKWRTICIHSV